MRTARRHVGLASIALALCAAGTAACTQPDDVVLSVQKEVVDGGTTVSGSGGVTAGTGGMTAGTGGTAAGTGGAAAGTGGAGTSPPAAPCMLADWYDSAATIDMMGCRIDKDDPAVQIAEKYIIRPAQAPDAGFEEGMPHYACDFVTNWFYEDKDHPDQYTLCPWACTALREQAAKELMRYRNCQTMR